MHTTSARSGTVEETRGEPYTLQHTTFFTQVLKRQPLLAAKKTYAPVLKAPLRHVQNLLGTKNK